MWTCHCILKHFFAFRHSAESRDNLISTWHWRRLFSESSASAYHRFMLSIFSLDKRKQRHAEAELMTFSPRTRVPWGTVILEVILSSSYVEKLRQAREPLWWRPKQALSFVKLCRVHKPKTLVTTTNSNSNDMCWNSLITIIIYISTAWQQQ